VLARIERNRSWWENLILAIVLPGVAGAVNASGFIALGVYTSHTTGNVARIGDELAQQHWEGAQQAAMLVGLFLLGAMTATALVEIAGRQSRPRYVVALLVQAMLLSLFALLSIHSERHWRYQRVELEATLCFAMGLQNALVTRLSGAVVRTTHLTGITTDIGIEAVRTLFWLSDRMAGRQTAVVPDAKRIRLHLSILLSFLSGATVGPALYLWIGASAMLLPVALLLLLAAFDALLGFGHSYAQPHAPGGKGHPHPKPPSLPRLGPLIPVALAPPAPRPISASGHSKHPQDPAAEPESAEGTAGGRKRLHPS
jgi:uncharacterized membrane protein YoaK (UPF0700 family)